MLKFYKENHRINDTYLLDTLVGKSQTAKCCGKIYTCNIKNSNKVHYHQITSTNTEIFSKDPFLNHSKTKKDDTKFWRWVITTPPHHNHFTALFPGSPGWAGARRELLDFMVQGKVNRGRHTDHPAGRHSIRTNQCLPPPSPCFLQAGCPSCRPTNSIKLLKATSAFRLGRRC